MNYVEAIGLLAGFLGLVAWVPQIQRIWIQKRADGISLPTFSIIAAAIALWLIYGILVDSLSLIISNSLVLVLILIVLIGAWKVQKEN
jgi:MtN3 and saliva related transmembrane protein